MLDKIIDFMKKNGPIILILVAAVFFRFYHLGSVPPGLHPDEAANGLDIIRMIEHHDFRAVYDTNGPREALFFYLQGIFVYIGYLTKWAWLNFTPLSLRIAPAAIGVLTVWGIYLLGKELFNKNVGLFAAAALATSAWHIHITRDGFRASMAPFALVFLFLYFFRAYKNGKMSDYVWTGVWLAIGFYTYLSFRMVPLILFALLAFVAIKDKKFIKENYKKMLALTGIFFLVMIPMIIHFYHVPADILGRASTSIFSSDINGGSPVKALAGNLVKTAGMFNVAGDTNWRHNVAGLPLMDPLTGVLLWVGAAICLVGIKKIENFFIYTGLVVMALPMVLTADGIPHALRAVGMIPFVFLFVGIAADWVTTKLKWKEAAATGTLIIVLISGAYAYWTYFVIFPTAVEAGQAYAEDMVNIAQNINESPANRRNILIVGEYGTKTVDFITHSSGHSYERYEVRDIKNINLKEGGYYKIFVEKDWYDEAKKELAKIGLRGTLVPVYSDINGQILYYAFPYVKLSN